MSVLVHYCHHCGFNTSVPYSPSAFHQLHDCAHCGRSTPGADLQGRSQAAEMSYTQQDELAQLFARNLNVSQPLPQHPATPDKQFIMEQPVQPPQIIYSSQHYTGAYHICPSVSPINTDSRADSPLSFPSNDIEDMLRRNNVDPSSLSPSQSKLFTNADYEQRLRLLELWQISPPENHNQAFAGPSSGDGWPTTSLAQEEEVARLSYQKRLEEQHAQVNSEAEPYVLSGYANPQRADPVYAAAPAPGQWQAMDGPYGAYQQTQYAQTQNHNYGAQYDDDMIM